MKISYNWLKDYLNFDIEPDQLSVILTSIGLEVDGMERWESVKGGLKGVVVGEVLTCEKHADSDHLSVTTVDIGTGEPLNIVCGAPNVAIGQKVLVATIGTTIYMGNDSFQIKKSKIRGAVSEGMICAEDELGLGTSHDGIMVLDPSAKIGTQGAEYCDIIVDYIYEIGLTPNRIDCGSHFGVARDLAAYLSLNNGDDFFAKKPSVENFKIDNNENPYEVEILNYEACPRYTGLTISGVTVGESPDWLKNRLKAVGLNPINNVVDITNFVQFEIGQPLHSFDADNISGKKVIVRNLPDGTKFVTLDGVERTLNGKDLMICDINEGMCIGGVFGGLGSGVTESTVNIFLESAYFNPVTIRKTSKRLGIKTDSSFRFERGVDHESTTYALKRAALLIKEVGGGKISSDIVDIYPKKIEKAKVEVIYGNIDRLIGKTIDRNVIKKILMLMDFNVISEGNDGLRLEVPAYRVDVTCEADVIEEILRIYGYNNVEIDDNVHSILYYPEKPDNESVVNIISDMLSSNGFAEIMCNSLNPATFYDNEPFDKDSLVMLSNPLSSDLNAMRQSLLYGGLSSVARNINHQNADMKLYEFGNCYSVKKREGEAPLANDFNQNRSLDLFISGNISRKRWNSEETASNFFHIKTAVDTVLKRLGIGADRIKTGENLKPYYAEAINYLINDKPLAEIGRVSKKFLKIFDIEQEVYYAHIEWDSVMKIIRKNRVGFSELPKYPWVRRDLALLVDRGVRFDQIKEIACKTERHLLRNVDLFDVYESASLGDNKKSYAVSFILRDDNNTLTDKNIDRIMNSFVSAFERELGAKIR
jgi:phenylalanyl-tRNA synthetase beta chain